MNANACQFNSAMLTLRLRPAKLHFHLISLLKQLSPVFLKLNLPGSLIRNFAPLPRVNHVLLCKQRVEIPITGPDNQPTSDTISISDPDQRFSAIIQQNIKHFSQATTELPVASGPLSNHLPPFSRNGVTSSILSSTFPLSSIDSLLEVQAFLESMETPLELKHKDPIDTAISGTDFQTGFRKFSNETASSPCGCHMTHY